MALAEKRVQIALVSAWCLVRYEDATHVLFDCLFTRIVWENMGITKVSPGGYDGDVVDIIQQLVSTCTRDKLALIVMVCWNLWNRKNRWLWDRVSISTFGVQEYVE